MPAQPRHRDQVVRTAAVLFRRQGYTATGTNQIVAESGAPKGSLYHYFPEGKEQIAQAAVEYAGARVTRTLADLVDRESTPGAALRTYGRRLAQRLEESDFRDGCPVATTLLELAPGSARVTAVGRAAMDGWAAVFSRALIGAGADERRARRLGALAVSTLEGALLVARVHQDGAAVIDAADEVAVLFDAATGHSAGSSRTRGGRSRDNGSR